MKTLSNAELYWLEKVEIISQKEVENFWSLASIDEAKALFPKNFPEEIIGDDDYFIIYLSGLSIMQMKKVRGQAIIQELKRRDSEYCSRSGYYLVKLKRADLENVVPHEELQQIPPNWRRANIREAFEIAYLLKARGIYFNNYWHACHGQVNNNTGRKSINLLKSSPEKIIAISRGIVSDRYSLNSITIMKNI